MSDELVFGLGLTMFIMGFVLLVFGLPLGEPVMLSSGLAGIWLVGRRVR